MLYIPKYNLCLSSYLNKVRRKGRSIYFLMHTREFIASRPVLGVMFNFFRQKEFVTRQIHGFTKEMKSTGNEIKEIHIVPIFCVFSIG